MPVVVQAQLRAEHISDVTASATLHTQQYIGKRQLLLIMELRRSLLLIDVVVFLLIGFPLFFAPSLIASFIFVSFSF